MIRTRHLSVEQLEDRVVPVVWGNPWPDALHLTASFVPDETQIVDQSSNLFESLGQNYDSETWQTEILRAFQTWAVHANINIGLVDDGGQALGSPGRPQGDSQFGDIRIAGVELASDVLAISTPFSVNSGTAAGDFRINTGADLGINGEGAVDLFTVALHEAGNVFGLEDTPNDPDSALQKYAGPRTQLGTQDIARLQAMYGVRDADQFEGSQGNDSFRNATRLSFLQDGDITYLQATGDITTLDDVDFYKFRAPLSLGGFNIRLQTEGLSLLSTKVTVYDSWHREIGSAIGTDPSGNDLSIHVNSFRPLRSYYVKVEGASEDVFGIGSYQLTVETVPLLYNPLQSLGGLVDRIGEPLLNDDLHLDDSMLTASLLPVRTQSVDSRFDYAYQGSIRDNYDVDFYRIATPSTVPEGSVMTVMAWGLKTSNLKPTVSVYDSNGALVDAEVLVNANGFFTLQIEGIEADETYFVKVEADNLAEGAERVGNYFLGVDFTDKAAELVTIAEGDLSANDLSDEGQLHVNQTQMAHFVLSADTESNTDVNVTLTIYDSENNVVGTLQARAGEEPASLSLLLRKGDYRVEFTIETEDGSEVPATHYILKISKESDPIGPQPEDPTEEPSDPYDSSGPDDYEPEYAQSEPNYNEDSYWTYYYEEEEESPSSVQPEDPYGDPYST